MRERDLTKVNIIDLEATCWNTNEEKVKNKSEIIEIGIAVVDVHDGEIVENESIYIKPQYSEISQFCTELTGITPEMVSNGLSFPEAAERLKKDYGFIKRINFSWGDYDSKQFTENCKMYGIKACFRTWMNLKALFALKMKLKREKGTYRAIKMLKLDFDGRHHSGKDDAYNIAKLYLRTL